ncbi:MAG: cyclic nucleotide-binding domain-containing protein [Proteobacteria bacterium]|nr:cyclic nucleotide-binding domain-containing protein [Pseudomonadota bacterium]MBU4258919.1 cyclic nucleotide-binding domain-containing protein [Pseudomonadota bacterium]MBU4287402.1 cyclic nucleotide-binding domain-containing protein [Pseudomonadota bacterium]MBU4413586.1 cyclic nucleotide-binding domain-containing protein [Pseudomonadota bacterium]MCG2758177.1 cyclic nucleotide-binding domain-containing protein [Desulfobacteraceae bacterium]
MLKTERIANLEIFNGLTQEEINAIISISQEVIYNKNEVIIEEFTRDSDLFVLLEGRVRVEIEGSHYCEAQDKKMELVLLRRGDIFGEIAFLKYTRSSAYVTAIDEIRIMRIDGEKLYELFDRNNHAGYVLMRNLAIVLSKRLVCLNFKWRDGSK